MSIRCLVGWILLISGFAACTMAGVAEDIRALTGAHSRMAWEHQITDSAGGRHADNVLVGIDTDDGKGERVICSKLSSYRKCIITPDGSRIVFTRSIPYVCTDACIINWDGTGERIITMGHAVDVWQDPATDIEWIYIMRKSWMTGGAGLFRYNADDSSQNEVVLKGKQINSHWFGLSPDGKRAGVCSPWPKIGVLSLENGSRGSLLLDSIGKGCHVQIAPDNSHRVFHVYGHDNIDTYDASGKKLARIFLNDLPGWDQSNVTAMEYYNRWSTDVRFLTFCGPVNRGSKVEQTNDVYIREFNANLTGVTSRFVRVTKNSTPDRFAHLWIAKGPPRPTLHLVPASLHFSGTKEGKDPSPQTVNLTAAGGLSLAGLVALPGKPWLKVTVSGTGTARTLTNLVRISGLDAGDHACAVTVKTDSIEKKYNVSLKILRSLGVSSFPSGKSRPLALKVRKSGKTGWGITVRLPGKAPFKLELFDILGKCMWTYQSPVADAGTYLVQSSAFSASMAEKGIGVFFVRLTQKGKFVCIRRCVPE